MLIHARTFWIPKNGSTEKEYEDSFFPVCARESVTREFRCATADGSSEGILSGIWARVLTRRWCRHPESPADIDGTLLARVYGDWSRWTRHYIRLRHQRNWPLKWYEEDGFRRGAFSTLLGFSLVEEGARWYAVAVGDSCLIQTCGEQAVRAFPLEHYSDFGNSPLLVSTNPDANVDLSNHIKRSQGTWQVNDVFYLMTDALAAWCLREVEADRCLHWQMFRDFDTRDEEHSFDKWIDHLRRTHRIRNDDVTLTRVDIMAEG
jgi:hypothetical protein